MPSAGDDAPANGPRPATAPQTAKPVTARSEALAPPGPNRTAAQSSSGSGA